MGAVPTLWTTDHEPQASTLRGTQTSQLGRTLWTPQRRKARGGPEAPRGAKHRVLVKAPTWTESPETLSLHGDPGPSQEGHQ